MLTRRHYPYSLRCLFPNTEMALNPCLRFSLSESPSESYILGLAPNWSQSRPSLQLSQRLALLCLARQFRTSRGVCRSFEIAASSLVFQLYGNTFMTPYCEGMPKKGMASMLSAAPCSTLIMMDVMIPQRSWNSKNLFYPLQRSCRGRFPSSQQTLSYTEQLVCT